MSNSSRASCGLTVLRVVVGIVFLAHGWQKMFGFKIPGVTRMVTGLGIPMPGFFAVVLTLVELLGGIALILGVATRVAAVLLAIDMTVAILKVHLPHGFFAQGGGYEFALTLLAATVCLALAGAGSVSVDGALAKKKPA
jgi:putative oxidoreductase